MEQYILYTFLMRLMLDTTWHMHFNRVLVAPQSIAKSHVFPLQVDAKDVLRGARQFPHPARSCNCEFVEVATYADAENITMKMEDITPDLEL